MENDRGITREIPLIKELDNSVDKRRGLLKHSGNVRGNKAKPC